MSVANRLFHELHAEEANRLDQLLRRFDRAWQRGERPSIDAYLEAAGHKRWAALIELVHADLEYRVQAGEPVHVEDYLLRYPELGRDAAVVHDLREAATELRGGPPAVPRNSCRGRSDR